MELADIYHLVVLLILLQSCFEFVLKDPIIIDNGNGINPYVEIG